MDRLRESAYETGVRLRAAREAGDPATLTGRLRSAGHSLATRSRLLQLAAIPEDLILALGGAAAVPIKNGARLGRALQRNPARVPVVLDHVRRGAVQRRGKPDWEALIALAEGRTPLGGRTRQILSGRGQRPVGSVGGAARRDSRLLIELLPHCPRRVKERLLAVLTEEFPGWASPLASSPVPRSTWDK
jgi:hypothetical protein